MSSAQLIIDYTDKIVNLNPVYPSSNYWRKFSEITGEIRKNPTIIHDILNDVLELLSILPHKFTYDIWTFEYQDAATSRNSIVNVLANYLESNPDKRPVFSEQYHLAYIFLTHFSTDVRDKIFGNNIKYTISQDDINDNNINVISKIYRTYENNKSNNSKNIIDLLFRKIN